MLRLDKAINEYNRYAANVVLTTFLTVMLWMAAQTLIAEGVQKYLPGLQTWQLAAIEVFIASYGLWWVSKRKNGDNVVEETKQHAELGCQKCKEWLVEHGQ